MSNTFIFLSMIFLHIVDDFHLQGILKDMKQLQWWRSHPKYLPMYRYDYVAALVIHCISWSFMTMLPIAVARGFNVGLNFISIFISQAILHGAIDDMKANMLKINLVTDQIIHFIQIAITFLCYVRGII